MEKGNYVYCEKDGVGIYGRVINKRISKFNKHQEVCSIQTKTGVYSEAHFDRVTLLPEAEASKLTYPDLHSMKNKKSKKIKETK